MKVGLIDSGDKTVSRMPNIGLAYLASTLEKAGYQVEILDLYFSDRKKQDNFFNMDWLLVGITCTSFSFVTALQIAKTIKQVNYHQNIVLGGPHVSVAKKEILTNEEFDFAIYGEGEKPLLALKLLPEI